MDRPNSSETYASGVVPIPNPSDEDRMQILVQLQSWSRGGRSPEGFPILAIGRVRKDVDQGEPLTLDDVFGSAHLTYDARCVLLLQRWAQPSTPGVTPVRLAIGKVSDGGECGEILLDFHYNVSQFRERGSVTAGPAAKGGNSNGKKSSDTSPKARKRG